VSATSAAMSLFDPWTLGSHSICVTSILGRSFQTDKVA